MLRRIVPLALASAVALSAAPARSHELWFQPTKPGDGTVRLTFADTPAPAEAERVAEIAHTRVWGDGKALEVVRQPDGLDARLPDPRPALLSAYADRGVIDYMGDTFVIQLAAYAQSRPIARSDAPALGLGDDQVRLLLVSDGKSAPVVRATWKGEPVPDLTVQVFRKAGEPPAVFELNGRGEMPCPSTATGPVSILAVVMDRTPGKRDGKAYTHTRFKATLAIGAEVAATASLDEGLDRLKEIHGAAGPWAFVGYRIGDRALRELGLSRHSFPLLIVHHSPPEVQYSCMADGLQAATGASPGKLNLLVKEAPIESLKSVVEDRKTGRRLTFVLRPDFVKSIKDLPYDRFESEVRRIAGLPDDAIFTISKSDSGAK